MAGQGEMGVAGEGNMGNLYGDRNALCGDNVRILAVILFVVL